jgi:predicted Zn-dependent protease
MTDYVAALAILVAGDPFKPSKSDQLRLGRSAAGDVRKKEPVLPDSDVRVQLVRTVGRKLLRTFNDRNQPWEYTFDVIDSPEVNAFALPGGPSFIYTGLLAKMKTEDEVAAVMGHEITHARREHWAYQQRDSNKASGALLLGALFGVQQDVLRGAATGYTFFVNLPFSRKHETEADKQGFDMMVAAGYNPQGMVALFELLRRESQGGKPPEFFSSHPDDRNRINNVKKWTQELNRSFPDTRPLVPEITRPPTPPNRNGRGERSSR